MKSKSLANISTPAAALLAGVAVLALSLGVRVPAVKASQSGPLHLMKECSQYTGGPGAFCTITFSTLPEIRVGSKLFYDQAVNVPPGLLDSNTVLDAGSGNRAVGRCTLDATTNIGLCRFVDGLGHFAGFSARLNVSSKDGLHYSLDGTYSFDPELGR